MKSSMNRRSFLKQSAAFGAVAVAGSAAKGGEKRLPLAMTTPRRGPNEELRIACIGIRSQGRNHIQAHAKGKNTKVVTLCDVDERLFGDRIKILAELNRPAPKTETDMRRVFEDKDVDAVSFATPNHWHALGTIWACQAGKDVYVEKPCSHNIHEGRKIMEAAAKYGRAVQVGTQNRSQAMIHDAVQAMRDGVIGEVYMARALCYKRRDSIGYKDDEPCPPEVHYDLWLGPAPVRPFNPNRFHYEWHWSWDYGNGDIGNQGVHQMDVAVWGFGKDRMLPVKASSMGGRYTYKDQGETPNTQVAMLQYDDGKMLVFEVRGRYTNNESSVGVGNLFYGSKGYMAIRGNEIVTHIEGKPGPAIKERRQSSIFENFHDVCRSRKMDDLYAPADIGHYSAVCCHLANIAYRLGRTLDFDPKTETFKNDAGANNMLSRDYRKPYFIPESV
ncbi:MAG TPA: Gfo/Idh/MocA family oxidoreductase [Phycisphaerae bacterium]|nr:Gfo/Idh/MocA family oxidoreductase [Phycisphaerae bacterium]